MATTLSNFLIGIGFDFDEKGAKQTESSIDSVRRTALQAGAAVAGAFGAKALTSDLSDRVAMLTRVADVYGSTAQEIQAMGMAMSREGGSLEGFIDQMKSIERLRAGLIKGKVDWIPQSAMDGLDTSAIINAENAVEAYKALADQFPSLSKMQQINLAQSLGLDDASINLLSQGRAELDKNLETYRAMREITPQLSEDSIEFVKNWADVWDNVAGITDQAGAQIIPKVNEITSSLNAWFKDNRESINETTANVFGAIAENLDLIAIAAASLSASKFGALLGMMAKHLPVIGGAASGVSSVAKGLGAIGMAFAGMEIVKNAGEGGALSATSLFGDNELTKFLDRPISSFFDSDSGATVIPPSATKPLESFNMFDKGDSSYGKYNQGGSGAVKQIVNNIYVDKNMVKQVVVDVMDEEDEQTLKNFTGSGKG